jgi:hypothetical protein
LRSLVLLAIAFTHTALAFSFRNVIAGFKPTRLASGLGAPAAGPVAGAIANSTVIGVRIRRLATLTLSRF